MSDKPEHVDSTGDDRTVNNVMRHEYRVLSDEEKATMTWLKDSGAAFVNYCDEIIASGHASVRELSLAKTKMEEAVMWAVKAITR